MENASLESTVMVIRFNLIFKMLCVIGDVTCALNAGQGRLLRYWRKSSAELSPGFTKVVVVLKPFTPDPLMQMIGGDNCVQGMSP